MTAAKPAHAGAPTHRVPVVVVIGGSEWGAYAVRQLLRAAAAGRLETEEVVVVDRDPACRIRVGDMGAPAGPPRVTLEVAEWSEWLDRRLDQLPSEAHLVPYHWAPHLFFEWLSRQISRAGVTVRKGPVPEAPRGVPFARPTGGHDLALSYATWICPPTCIEPARCPHTKGEKSWTLCGDLDTGATGLDATIVLRSLHLVYGVATVPLAALLAARERLRAGALVGRRRYRIATASHCHGLAATLEVDPRAS